MLGKLYNLVRDFENPDRAALFMMRRMGKTVEELGEVWEAYLDVTSLNASREEDKNLNVGPKGKKWADVKEEAVDLLICALDLVCTELPIDEGKTREEFESEILELMHLKLAKWKSKL
jgi:hypothetical protein